MARALMSDSPGPVLLLDTSSLFFRAHHALPPMNTRSGEPTSASYGLSLLLLKLFREERPIGLAWAKDGPERTFRHVAFSAYKAQRPPIPDTLRRQLERLDELIAASGGPSFVAPGFEADDVLATLAREIRREHAAQRVRVVTGDRTPRSLAWARRRRAH